MNLEIQNLNFLLLFVAEENLLLLEILWHCFTVVCYHGNTCYYGSYYGNTCYYGSYHGNTVLWVLCVRLHFSLINTLTASNSFQYIYR